MFSPPALGTSGRHPLHRTLSAVERSTQAGEGRAAAATPLGLQNYLLFVLASAPSVRDSDSGAESAWGLCCASRTFLKTGILREWELPCTHEVHVTRAQGARGARPARTRAGAGGQALQGRRQVVPGCRGDFHLEELGRGASSTASCLASPTPQPRAWLHGVQG